MSKSTISTSELFQMFPGQETARLYLESRLWPDGVACPTCRKGERITTRKGGYKSAEDAARYVCQLIKCVGGDAENVDIWIERTTRTRWKCNEEKYDK